MMLFAVIYTARALTEAQEKRSLELFTNWKPPSGYEFKNHYAFADGSGGIGLVEAKSAAALLEAHTPWVTFFDFKTVPLVEVSESVPISQKVLRWRESIK
jgi:hypothetical protein